MKEASNLETLSKYRILANNLLRLTHGSTYPILMNIDVDAQALLKFKKEKGYSLNTILTKLITEVFTENPRFKNLNSVLQKGLNSQKLVVANNVSFALAVDKTWNGERVACVWVLENVDQRSYEDVDKELKYAATLEIEDFPIYQKLKIIMKLPSFVQRFLLWLNSLVPRTDAVTLGSIGLSNLGKGSVQTFSPLSAKTLIFGIGGIVKKVYKENDSFVEKETMAININFNHYVVDGKIASEFLSVLKEKIESICVD